MAVSSTSILSPSSGTSANWLATAMSDIQANESASGGMLGALKASTSSSANSISSFINDTTSDNLASIAQSGVTSRSAFIAQIASQQNQARQKETLEKALKALSDSRNAVQPKNVLDPNVYFEDGSYIDTERNILTMSDGNQFDTVTGLKYVDPDSRVSFSDGSYLDTKSNVLTMADGTQIDTVTGLKLSTTA